MNFCPHAQNLPLSAAQDMENAGMSKFHCWDDIISEDFVKKSTYGEHTPASNHSFNPLLCQLSFRPQPAYNYYDKTDHDAHLRPPQVASGTQQLSEVQQRQRYGWRKHPIAQRSFATFPPIAELYFAPRFFFNVIATGRFGVTMVDVVLAMAPR